MPTSTKDVIVLAFGIFGLVWYFVCLFMIGLKPLPPGQNPDGVRQFQTLSITTISVTLATFVGMLLGITGVSQNVQQEAPNTVALTATPQLQQLAQGTATTTLQWLCAALYLLSLVLALVFLLRHRDKTDPVISNLAKSLLGIAGGALSVWLNLPTP